MNLNVVWNEFLKIINEEAGSRVVETWFKAVTLSSWDSFTKTVYLKAPNAFIKDWISNNYLNLFKTHIGRLLSEKEINIIFLNESKVELAVEPVLSKKLNKKSTKNEIISTKKVFSLSSNINPDYKFSSFIVGPNNSLAYAASKAVADKPGTLYNPLLLYGNSGLGKTHLLHAIANQIKSYNSKLKIIYQSADRFVNEFINAIRFNKVTNFEAKYKFADILLIDDIQFISNKEQTQEAFFHIFNTLYDNKKQIIFSSDCLPNEIQGLADRLKSRLSGGLITDVQKPSLETKIAILKRKADLYNETLNDEVAQFIASRGSNVRELEGLLIRIFAFSSLTQQSINLELVQKVLFKTTKDQSSKKQITDAQQIVKIISNFYNFSINDLRSSKRLKAIVFARHLSMYFMKKYTDSSLSDIAIFFKRRDHSTVIHAIEKIEQIKDKDETIFKDFQKIEDQIIKL